MAIDRSELDFTLIEGGWGHLPPTNVRIHVNDETLDLHIEGKPDVPDQWRAPDGKPAGPKGVILAAREAAESVRTKNPGADPSDIYFAAFTEIVTREYGVGSFWDSVERSRDRSLPEAERLAALHWIARHGFPRPIHGCLFRCVTDQLRHMGESLPERRANWYEDDLPGICSFDCLLEASLLIAVSELDAPSAQMAYDQLRGKVESMMVSFFLIPHYWRRVGSDHLETRLPDEPAASQVEPQAGPEQSTDTCTMETVIAGLSTLVGLSGRELELARRYAEFGTLPKAAAAMNVSPGTAKSMWSRIKKKCRESHVDRTTVCSQLVLEFDLLM